LNVTVDPTRAFSPHDVRRFLSLVHEPGSVFELRIPKYGPYRSTASGYFNDLDAAIEAVRRWDGKANVYVTLNPASHTLLARAANRIIDRAANATADADIVRRHWLFLDIDAERASGISSTNEELQAATDVADALADHLRDGGWPEPVRAMSGNGEYLLYRLDLSNDAESTDLMQRVLEALAVRFDTNGAHIDRTVHNASRIIGLVGTLKVKGDPLPDRPHRRSTLTSVPHSQDCVTREQIESIAGPFEKPKLRIVGRSDALEALADLLQRRGIEFREQPPDANRITWYHVKQCPFHEDGRSFECGVGQALPDGRYAGKCFHPEGNGKGWSAWKAALGLNARRLSRKTAIVSPTEPDDEFRRTDAGNGELFANLYGDRVRYDHRRRRWLMWGGHHWTEDCDGEIRRLAKLAARHRYLTAAGVEDLNARAAVARFAIDSENRKRLDAVLVQAQTERPIADSGVAWNSDPLLLAVSNGIVDLRAGVLRPGEPTDKITLHVPVAFDPAAICHRWLRFLDEVFRGDAELIDFIQRAVGYSLTGITLEQCLFLCYGKGSNGKSVFLAVLRALAGEYAYNAPFSLFEMQGRGAIPNDVAALVSRRLVSSSETNEGARLNEARIKALTGCDPITARFLHGEFFTFDPVAKYWLAVNHKPKVADDSHGFWRRVRLIPFLRQFDEGKDADQGLTASLLEELPGIVAWAVRGALAWQERGIPAPAAVRSATETYRAESDPLAQFIDECCITGDSFAMPAAQGFKAYKAWCIDQGMSDRDMLGSTAFGTRMSAKFDKRHTKRGNAYDGVGLASDRPDEPEVKGWVKGCESDNDETEVFPLEHSLAGENPEIAFTTLHPSPDEEPTKCSTCFRTAQGRTESGTPVCGMHAAQVQREDRKFGRTR